MSFNFKAAVAASKPSTDSLLSAIVLGPSGAGKSTLCGTIGVKTLYLYLSGEDHGPGNATLFGGSNVHALCLDVGVDEAGESYQRKPDETLKYLQQALESPTTFKADGFKAVVLDSATELEAVIRASEEWKNACLTKNKEHNSFAETGATLNILRRVVLAIKQLQRQTDAHFVIPCVLDVKSYGDMGEIEEAVPRLTGYAVAEGLIQMMGDVIVVGRMTKGDVAKYKLQFMTDVTKASKDLQGRVKKTINFAPRLKGVKTTELPPYLDANLAEVVKLKKGGKK